MTGVINDIYDNIKYVPENMEIAIWGMYQERFHVLTKAVNARVRVEYFIDTEATYIGPAVFDKKIIDKNLLVEKEDIFVLISTSSYKDNREWIDKYLSGRYSVIGIDAIDKDICSSKCIYIYGAGDAGRRTLQILNEHGIMIQGFIDSSEEKIGKEWCGRPIYHRSVLQEEDAVIISSVHYAEIYETLSDSFNEGNIFIDYRNARVSRLPVRYSDMNSVWIKYKHYPLEMIEEIRIFYATLLNDFWEKEIILYGKNEIAEQIIEVFDLLGMKTAYIVDEDVTDAKEMMLDCKVKDVYDLTYENMNDKLILITKVNGLSTEKEKVVILDGGALLEDLGYKFYRHFRSALRIAYNNRNAISDKLLDYAMLYERTPEKYKGFYIVGKEENYKRKIVVLGGSTSDPGTYENQVTSWPEYLAQKYDDVVIYSGAVQGHNVIQECLKLLRDVRVLKPDLIISYSGINDIDIRRDKLHPFVKTKQMQLMPDMWYGIEDDIDSSELWVLMEQYMQAIANINGSDFIAILQPALVHKRMEDLMDIENILSKVYDKTDSVYAYDAFTQRVKENIGQFDWMYDLTSAFEGVKENVYRDFAHLTDRGNEIIADKVYDIINDYYKRKRK